MDIEDRLKTILIDDLYVEVPKNNIKADDSLRDVLGIDSLGFVELKEQIEAKFAVIITDEAFTPENFSTIRSLTTLIQREARAA
jgi:acyl carrier protein